MLVCSSILLCRTFTSEAFLLQNKVSYACLPTQSPHPHLLSNASPFRHLTTTKHFSLFKNNYHHHHNSSSITNSNGSNNNARRKTTSFLQALPLRLTVFSLDVHSHLGNSKARKETSLENWPEKNIKCRVPRYCINNMKHTLLVYDSSWTHGLNIVSLILYTSRRQRDLENSASRFFEV